MSSHPPRASGYFRTSYGQDFKLLETRTQRLTALVTAMALLVLPFAASPFLLDLAAQVLLACVGALALALLTGYAGQVSLGHAGLIAAGAFTAGIMFKEWAAPFWLTLPAAALTGAVLGIVFGLPSLRLRGLYLAVSTLALHFVVVYVGGEYETRRGLSSGIIIDPPSLAGITFSSGRAWYFIMLAAALLTLLASINVLRGRTGRAWRSVYANETVAGALGINVGFAKLSAFVVSSSITALAGALFAYYRGFVSVEAFSLYLSIQYIAMIIIGGMGSLLGAILGAIFVTLFPYAIEALVGLIPGGERYAGDLFAVNYAAFGVVMVLFLVFEPLGLVGIWRRIQTFFLLWPFKQQPVGGARR